VTGDLRRLLWSLLVANFSIFIIWGSVPTILLAFQVQGIDPAHKAAQLALITAVGALCATVAQPIAGVISDRTRSRFGKRARWMVAGAFVGGLALVGMGLANTIVQLLIGWIIVQVAYNFAQGPLSAIMPDRTPTTVRGTFSAFAGIGLMVGSVAGQIVGATLSGHIFGAYLLMAGLALVVLVLFLVFNPDVDNRAEPRAPFRLGDFLRTFWVSPRQHPDFFWGFTGRLLLYVGYFLISGYLLYILQDYIGLGKAGVGWIPFLGVATLIGIVASIAIAGPLSDRLQRRKIFVVIAAVLVAVALAIPFISPTLPAMFAFALISGLGFGAYQAVDTALVSEILPARDTFAKDLGVVNIAQALPQTVAPALAGTIVVLFHSYAALFPIGAVVVVLGAAAILPIKAVR
jgi:MFS family permease